MKSLLISLLLLSAPAFAEDRPLFFPLEKAPVKVLPQRFEFELIDAENIRIGDAKMNMGLLDVEMNPAGNDQWSLRFQWPASLVKSGDLVIKDNIGKALWSIPISASDVRTMQKDSDLVGYFSKQISAPQSEAILKRAPYFKVCIHKQEPTTRIFLCSKELYFSQKNNVRPRKRADAPAVIEINGKAVSQQGLIFLNSPNEFLQLRSELSSGNSLEIETRMKSVDFKDVSLSTDEKEIIITAEGAEPVENMQNIKRRGKMWTTRLPIENPVIYLKAEGDIPLRQEFILQGGLRRDGIEIVAEDPPAFSYRENVTLDLKTNSNARLSPANNQSSVSGKSWTLKKLVKNENNRRYLKVSDNDKSYVAAYDITRASPNDISARLGYPLIFTTRYEHWLGESWGTGWQLDYRILKSDNDLSFNAIRGEAIYRLNPGIHMMDPSLKIALYGQRVSLGSEAPILMGLGLIAEAKNAWLMRDTFSWHIFKIYYPLMSSGTFKNKQSMDLEYLLRHFSNSTVYYDAGIRYGAFKFADSDNNEIKQGWLNFFASAGWLF